MRYLLSLGFLFSSMAVWAQQPADAPPEAAIRRYVQPPGKSLALYEKRTDVKPVMQWSARYKLYVQTAPDTVWYRVLVAGNSYFVRQRELPMDK